MRKLCQCTVQCALKSTVIDEKYFNGEFSTVAISNGPLVIQGCDEIVIWIECNECYDMIYCTQINRHCSLVMCWRRRIGICNLENEIQYNSGEIYCMTV